MTMNTYDYKKFCSERYKENTRKHWNANPCEAHEPGSAMQMTKEYFDELTLKRYEDQKWLLEEIHTLDVKGKKVLEIGYGMGTDHLELSKMGGDMYGISITPGDKKIVDERFKLYGKHTETTVADAEDLPYASDFFDFVYSFGVLHHTPNFEKSVSEIYRVLKKDGECFIAVYNKNSMFFWWSVFLWTWILNGSFRKYSLQERLSLIEYPNDDPNLVVKLYTKKQLKRIMKEAGFHIESISVNHLNRKSIEHNKIFSDKFISRMATKWGWYLIVKAKKM